MLLAIAALSVLAPIPFPGGAGGIGFDDMTFAPRLHRVMVPGGRTGRLMLIDPATRNPETIDGFSERGSYAGGHGEGITSADEGRGFIFATDRTSKRLDLLDVRTRKIIATASLGSGPDYVRFVPETNEVWVTEPRAQGVEIFSLPAEGAAQPVRAGFIEVPGGPESLVIDHSRGRAYTNLWTDTTIVIDLKQRKIVSRWPNGCEGSRGLALDEKRGLLFVGCNEGKLRVLDDTSGKQLGAASTGAGVDIIAYNSALSHAYLPGAESATMTTIEISSGGKATVIGTIPTARNAHCVATDDRGHVYVCDPEGGRILVFQDSPPG